MVVPPIALTLKFGLCIVVFEALRLLEWKGRFVEYSVVPMVILTLGLGGLRLRIGFFGGTGRCGSWKGEWGWVYVRVDADIPL